MLEASFLTFFKAQINEMARAALFSLMQKSIQNPSVATVIDLESYKVEESSNLQEKRWVGSLSEKDHIILTEGGWLNDDIINASQQLISKHFPKINLVSSGLQDVALGKILAFSVQNDQIIHTEYDGSHWVTVSNVGCKDSEVNIFDCMTPVPTCDMLQQVAALLATCKPTMTLRYVDVQMQNGSADCGLLACCNSGKWGESWKIHI